MSTLYLPLKKEWYKMIESGEKREEYRETSNYWKSRLMQYSLRYGVRDYVFKPLDDVRFSYGYTKKTITFKIDTITIGRGKPEWGAPTDRDVFIIKLGEKKKGGEE